MQYLLGERDLGRDAAELPNEAPVSSAVPNQAIRNFR